MQDVEAGVLNHRAVNRLLIPRSLARDNGDQLLLSFGKELWVVVEVVVTGGEVRMGLGLSTLRIPPLLLLKVGVVFCALAGVADGLWSIDQRHHHAANTSSAALGHTRLFVDNVLISLVRIPQRGVAGRC